MLKNSVVKFEPTIYMLIDITILEETKVILVAPLKSVELLGKIQQAQGKIVIAPPLEGRGFSKLEKSQLQYLYWNTCNQTPPEDYGVLVAACLEVLLKLPLDNTSIANLEKEVARLYPDGPGTEAVQPKDPNAPPSRPRTAGATGKVWEIADRLFEENGGLPERKTVLAACEADGVNAATASTQFSKWKASKLASK